MMSEEKEKEAAINERIERIRKQNEEIRRRHMEVQADKQNADVFSSSAPPSCPKPKTVPVAKPPRERPAPPVSRPRMQDRSSPMSAEPSQRPNSSKIYSNFAEGEGPPPDPGYSFLADDERDQPRVEVKPKTSNTNDSDKFTSQKSTREKSSKFGGKPRGRRQDQRPQRSNHRGQGQSSNKGNPGDEKWREERAAIDEARIQRQKTAAGSWRREWDIEKLDEADIDVGGKLNTQTFGGRGAPRSPPKQWGDRQTYRGRGFIDSRTMGAEHYRNTDDRSFVRGGRRMNPFPSSSQDSNFDSYRNQETKPAAISILRKPVPVQDTREDVNSANKQTVPPMRQGLNNGEDLRILLRSKSNESGEVTSIRRNIPERRSFGSGRVSHHHMDSHSSRGSQSEEEGYFKKSNPSMCQESPQPPDLSNLKISMLPGGKKASQVYWDRPLIRPLHSQTKENAELKITSLPQRDANKTEIPAKGFEQLIASKMLQSEVKTADEGEESWDDFSDNE